MNVVFILFAIFAISYSQFADYTPYTYPDSITQSELCGQEKPSFFCDPNMIVQRSQTNSTTYKSTIGEELLFVRGETNCSCPLSTMCDKSPRGYTISIAIVERMHLDASETSRSEILEAAKLFADTVRDRQNRGQCDDDILIFVSARDEVIWTSIGQMVKLDQKTIRKISEQAEVLFKKMEYEEAIRWMIRQFKHSLRQERLEKLWNWPLPEWVMIFLSVLLLIVIGSLTCTIVYFCIRLCRRDRRDEYSVVNNS